MIMCGPLVRPCTFILFKQFYVCRRYRAFTGSELNMPKDNSNAQVDISERISEEPLIPHKLKLLLLQMLQVEPAERINATAIMVRI